MNEARTFIIRSRWTVIVETEVVQTAPPTVTDIDDIVEHVGETLWVTGDSDIDDIRYEGESVFEVVDDGLRVLAV